MPITLSSYIITETMLGVQCAQMLLERNHVILGLITTDSRVIDWAHQNSIPIFRTLEEFDSSNPAQTFDYLFSIVNGKILTPDILTYPRSLAINYHDAPLPKYAGIHATSWAIINDEQEHGISWHVMSSGVDEGDILEQRTFKIDSNDTALTLNLKCATHALEGFKSLVNRLEQNSIIPLPQDLQYRSYYGYHQKPKHSELIDWERPAEEIERLFRSLYFGDYNNKMASFKILIGNEVFFPQDLKIQPRKSKNEPGVLLQIQDKGLEVSTATRDLLVTDIVDSRGSLWSPATLKKEFGLYEGMKMPTISLKLREHLTAALVKVSYTEKYWVSQFLDSVPVILPLNNSVNNTAPHSLKDTQNMYEFITAKIDKKLIQNALQQFDSIEFLDVFLSAIMISLWHLQPKSSITVSYTDEGLEGIVGQLGSFLSSDVPFTLNLSGTLSGIEAIQRSTEKRSVLSKKGTYPLDLLERYPSLKELEHAQPDVKISVLNLQERLRKEKEEYLLEICLDPTEEEYSLIFTNSLEETEKYFITSLPNQINFLLESLVNSPLELIQNLSLVPLEVQKQLLQQWNNTDTQSSSPSTLTLHHLFEECVRHNFNKVAIKCENRVLRYSELNEQVNRLASYIKTVQEIRSDTLVILFLERDEFLLIALLSVLKSGGAYVPVDPRYPDERIRYILEDTDARLVLTNMRHVDRIKNLSPAHQVLAIDNQETVQELVLHSSTNPEVGVHPSALAYVIYTSGSTGQPKGVMIEHKSIVNLLLAVQEVLDVGIKDNFLFYRSYVFDGVIEETLLPLMIGATLTICPTGVEDLPLFCQIIEEHQISIINMNSETANALSEYIKPAGSLIKIIAGGTKLNLRAFSKFLDQHITLFNSYGPTECTVDTTYYKVENLTTNFIGKPLLNYKCYVLNENLSLLPIGAIGELYVGGTGLARGYLGSPALTEQSFILNPFQTLEDKKDIEYGNSGRNARLYKTGDLVRWLPNGNLDYIGRKDSQVKIRGFRIELGEIEQSLLSYQGIKQSVVLVREKATGDKYLIGYYVSEGAINEEGVLLYLKSKLPEYMVPAILKYLPAIPLTLSGKVDKSALPEPQFAANLLCMPPTSEVEKHMVKVWAEVLGLPEDAVGIEDNFFRLGGDSILSIQIVSRLRQRHNLVVSVKDIFTHKTIKALCQNTLYITEVPRKIKTEQGRLSGPVMLLPIQEWFFQSQFSYPHYWNQAFIIKVPELNVANLKNSITQLVDYHDAFRLRYRKPETGRIPESQFYDPTGTIPEIKILDLRILNPKTRHRELQDIFSQWQSEFDLYQGPLHCVGYIYGYEDRTARIFFALHHLIVDTVSWRILVEDLKNIYHGEKLHNKGSSYRQWTESIQEYGVLHDNERHYWSNMLSDYNPSHYLSRLGLDSRCNIIHAENFSLNKSQTKDLLTKAHHVYNTQVNDILLVALAYALKELTENSDNHIVLEGHGREEIDHEIDITKTLGWFTTIFPVRLRVEDDIDQTIKLMKETLRSIPNRGIGYGALCGYNDLHLPKIYFNYLGQLDKGDNAHLHFGWWSITQEEGGLWRHPNNSSTDIINIIGSIIDGCLHFKIIDKLSEAKSDIFKHSLKSNLEHVISYLSKQKRSYLTTSDINNIISQKSLDQIQAAVEIVGVYKANSLQEGFIYHFLNQGGVDDAYVVHMTWQYSGLLDLEYLQKAWQLAQDKYPSLRLRFHWDEALVQIVDSKSVLRWRYTDLSSIQDKIQQSLHIQTIHELDKKEKYNLAETGLFRVYIIKLSNTSYTCLFSHHHAILDGWSYPILLKYIHDTYFRLLKGDEVEHSLDQAYLESQQYMQETCSQNENYWKENINKIEDYVDLSILQSPESLSNQIKINEHKHITDPKQRILKIPGNTYYSLKKLAQKEDVTLNAILQYVWHLILRVYGTRNDKISSTVVGTTIAGRELPVANIETSVGLYINTLPLIVEHGIGDECVLIDEIRKIQEKIIELSSRSASNLSKLQKEGKRLFDSLFVYQNYPNPYEKELSTRDTKYHYSRENSKVGTQLNIEFREVYGKLDYPLAVIAYEEEDSLSLTLRYAGELFAEETIAQLINMVNTILEQILAIQDDPNFKLKDLKLCNKEEEDVLGEWNDTGDMPLSSHTINSLFEKQAAKTPDNIAVICAERNKSYTYSTLLEESNYLAKYIVLQNKQRGINAEGQLIGILAEKGYSQVICALSIMKAGGCYLPLNVEWPVAKLDEILTEGLVITLFISQNQFQNEHLKGELSPKYELFVIEEVLQNLGNILTQLVNTPLPFISNKDIAYVIFTSGSTGKPKGVTIQHKGAVNTIEAINLKFNIKQTDKILALSEFSFDLSVYDIFGMLFTGGTIVLPMQSETRETNHWISLINQYHITIWNTVPQLASLLITNPYFNSDNTSLDSTLRMFLLSGDYVPKALPNALISLFRNATVVSLGGATEGSIWSIWYEVSAQQSWKQVPYGFPMPSQKMHILNAYQQLCPIGAIGEIYIGGVGVALHYWNNNIKTKESFILHPLLGKIYKTGDLGRWNKDGYIEYLGRLDFQVKVRGFRVELGEIESVLASYEDIKQSVVVAKHSKASNREGVAQNDKYLVAYYISHSGYRLDENKLVEFLNRKLPDYMVPSIIMYLEQLPLTINGKLDRNSLPEPEFKESREYVPPRNAIEAKICRIFAEILGIDATSVGVRDSFFRLGGNSILAIKLANKINKETGMQIGVASIFTHKNVENLISASLRIEFKGHVIEKANTQEIAPLLSFAQERLWFIEKYEQGTNAYNIPLVSKIRKNISLSLLKESINSIVKRHEILRTLIKENEEGQAYQKVCSFNTKYIKEIKVDSLMALKTRLTKDVNYIYNLSTEYPIRVRIYNLNSDYYLAVVIHHIACDGWSTNIFFKELEQYCQYHSKTRLEINSSSPDAGFPTLTIQYKDFASWQRNYLKGNILTKQLDYWKNKLEGYETLNLYTDYVRPSMMDYHGDKIYFELDYALSTHLKKLAQRLEVSLYSLLLSAYMVMLKVYTNQDDIVIGTLLSNRHYAQVENLIGFFVNTLPIRISINSSYTLVDFVKKVADEIIACQLHQDLPFEKLVDSLNIGKDTSRHPIFQVIFGVQSLEEIGHEVKEDSVLEKCAIPLHDYEIAKFDLETFLDDSSEILKGYFNYRVSLYKRDTIAGFIETYIHLLKQLAELDSNYYDTNQEGKDNYILEAEESDRVQHKTIANLTYLNKEDHDLIIHQWNNNNVEYPSTKTIHRLFEEQVERSPNNIALVYENIQFTYKELNHIANNVAHRLIRKHNVKTNNLIIFLLDRNETIIIFLMGVLKAGGAYVPLDPEYPEERIRFVLQDTQARIVVTNQKHAKKLKELGGDLDITVITIEDALSQEELENYDYSTPPLDISRSTDLAYLIYTSGTTGTPKGVMIEHRGVVNLALMQGKSFGLEVVYSNTKAADIKNCLCYANYVFDASVSEIFTSLLSGNRLHLLSQDSRFNFESIEEYITKNKIDIATIPPALLTKHDACLPLKTLVVAGEKLSSRLFESYLAKGTNVINAYGPTETTVCSNLRYYTEGDRVSNIGTPLANTKSYVLSSASLAPVPIGAIGELYIGGVGVAKGYWNNSPLTVERFMTNPFQTLEEKKDTVYGETGRNARMYKTGDLVRWLPDGNLEYIGRVDFQIKLKGYRIELGEIEAAIISYEGINEGIVLFKEDKNTDIQSVSRKFLIGYYIAEYKIEAEDILRYLRSRLPYYMIPHALLQLDKFPLTINGKLDRKALLDLSWDSNASNTDKRHVTLPRNEVEQKLCQLWAEVLDLSSENVGLDTDFFMLGGDSILSMQLASKIRIELSLGPISIKDLFTYKTPGMLYENLIKFMINKNEQEKIISEQGNLSGTVPLLPIQRWFFESSFVLPSHWNQSFLIVTPLLDLDVLQKSINALIAHHDAFHLRYTKKNRQYYSKYGDTPLLKVANIKDLASRDLLGNILTSWQSRFNLETGPLCSFGYVDGFEDGTARIFVAAHHLIMDAVSWRVVTFDLQNLYYNILRGNTSSLLGSKGTSYRQWCQAILRYKDTHKEEQIYWGQICSSMPEYNAKLASLSTSSRMSSNFSLTIEQTRQLVKNSTKAYNTGVNALLVAAFSLSLNETLGIQTNYITLEGHGREDKVSEKHLDVSRTVGWFTIMYPVRLETRKDPDGIISGTIKYTKETLKQIPNKGVGFGSIIGYHSNRLPKIIFNYLGQFEQKINQKQNNDMKDVWYITSEYSGQSIEHRNKDHSIININSAIMEGKCEFRVATMLEESVHDMLVSNFQKHVKEVIDYTLNHRGEEYTMSDYSQFQPYIEYNTHFTTNPIFMMPPGEGGSESYVNNIVLELSSQERLIVFNNFFRHIIENDNQREKLMSFEKIAFDYICYIKSIQPEGPYTLFGWSFGGVLAFEITKQLISQGDRVQNLVMIDSYFGFKTIAHKSNLGDMEHNINYKYSPVIHSHELEAWNNTIIQLFKASNIDLKEHTHLHPADSYYKINQYYVNHTQHNHLDKILSTKFFNTHLMPHSHTSWIMDKTQINQICNSILRESY